MKAIIFAAGLGTRLYPLTSDKPKALVELAGKPMIYHAIEYLKKSGVDEIVVNVHHFADLLIQYLQSTDWNVKIDISDERDLLLDTGGGLFKARDFLCDSDPFIAYNVDVISSVDLQKVVDYHKKHDPISTLVVRRRPTSRYLMFNKDHQLTGWNNEATSTLIVSRPDVEFSDPMAFSGIQVVSPKIFDLIDNEEPFSITSLYLKLAEEHPILGYFDASNFWIDLGKPEQLEKAEKYLSGEK